MSTTTTMTMKESIIRAMDNFYFDWVSGVLAALFAAVSFISAYAIHRVGDIEGGAVASNPYDWTAILLILAGMVLGAVLLGSLNKVIKRVYQFINSLIEKYVPQWLADLLKYDSKHVWLIPAAVVNFYTIGTGFQPAFLVLTILFELAIIFDIFWIPFDIIALNLSVIIAVVVGTIMAPVIVIALLIGVAIVDHIEVNLTGIMDDAAMAAVEWTLPNIIIIPTTWQFVVSDMKEKLENQGEENNIGTLIGAGDFALPAALPASVSLFTGSTSTFFGFTLPVITSVAGIVIASIVLRSRASNKGETTPGIPYLATGAIVGLLIGSIVSSDPIPVVLGLHDTAQPAIPF